MSSVEIKNLKGVSMALASRKTQIRETFNKNLFSLVEDWQKASANTFVNSGGVDGYKAITSVQPLEREKGGTRGVIKAKITLEVKAISLTDFFVEQQRVTLGQATNAASVKRGKYKEHAATNSSLFTKAKLLKQGGTKLVVVGDNKKRTLKRAKGLKGFMYSPTNRVTAKDSTPLGVYVRLQKKTWAKGKRLPIYKLYAPPLAIIMLSPRILKRINFDKRIRNLYGN
jgi:hypothetical protein